tara:strand:- start:440 stop:1132 length:693 start_codon:yes stop_codon:yes gene_type:complete
MNILITRPIVQSRRFYSYLIRNFGNRVNIIISPVIKIKPFVVDIGLNQFDGIIFTSENAVKAFEKLDINTKKGIFCVGRQTAKYAEFIGLSVSHTERDTTDLIAFLLKNKIQLRLLYLCGNNISVDLTKALSTSLTSVYSKVIYEQVPMKLTREAIELLSQKNPVLVPIFSERSGCFLSKQFTKKMTSPRIAVCLSSQIANNIAKNEYDKILTSQNPDMESLIALLKEII